MKYLENTIVEYIKKECKVEIGTARFILPAFPSRLLLNIGKTLDDHFNEMKDREIRFIFGVAYRLGEQWKLANNPDFTLIKAKNWYNESDNLTSLRNEIKSEEVDNLVVLLAGYEQINDKASLQDFFHLDQQVIWDICLKRSFKDWLQKSLKPFLNLDDSVTELNNINELFKVLYENGLADILKISSYLEEQNFSDVMNGTDAYKKILNNLSIFGLPCMVGMTGRYARKHFSSYVIPALDFFDYSMFINENNRKNYIDRINKFVASNPTEPDSEVLGNYNSLESLLNDLKKYINLQSEEARINLKISDFIYILERILGFRQKRNETNKDKKPKRLKGLPPEVFLHAIWLTLGEFKKTTKSVLTTDDLSGIAIKSILFKHDFDAGEEDDGADDRKMAEQFISRVIGGIDEFFEDHIRLSLGDINNPFSVLFVSKLSPHNNDSLVYTKTATAEPTFLFEVTVSSERYESITRQFLWALPQYHQSRLLVDFYEFAWEGFKDIENNALPAFALPYMTELFMARDKDEVNRVTATALQNESCSMIDLLKAPGLDDRDEVKTLLSELSIAYQEFLTEFNSSGFFNALKNSYEGLRIAFNKAYSRYLEKSDVNALGPLLFKAFMIVAENEQKQANWSWSEYLKAAVITPLHPALLDMIRHQNTYLCESFCYYGRKALEETGERTISEKRWDRVVDLSTIQRPIYGVLKDANLVLNTNVRSYDYIHLVGEYSEDSSFINSRLLLEYDTEEEDISDTELFRETRSSRLIKQVLLDYRDLYEFANDGISIGAYCGRDIQPVIAGIDLFLSEILKINKEENRYTLSLTIFSDSRDDTAIMRWINAWKDRWQSEEISGGQQFYNNCKISISYRVVSKANYYDQFTNILQTINFDVIIFSDFVESQASKFELLDEVPVLQDDYRKFPILEKYFCKVVGGGWDHQRERVLNNPRFRLSAMHTEVMAHIVNKGSNANKRHAVISKSDYKPWVNVINSGHKNSAWVVCIDPIIDEQLLIAFNDEKIREIIGLGTGVGLHGESNYTISTEQFSLSDIKRKIGVEISSLLVPLENNEREKISNSLVKEADRISGLSVVKATGPTRYVRELIANTIIRKLLPQDKNVFCDLIVSLDAFLHWFDDAIDGKRPDLLRLRANIVNGYFDIDAQIIECKLSKHSEGYLEKARQQIESGLRQLISCFSPKGERPVGINDRPDQRYWWMQIHRLIASKGETNMPKRKETLTALERLSEGYFNIHWQAAAVAFWTDIESSSISINPEWSFNVEGQEMTISVVSAGVSFIKKTCLENTVVDIFSNASKMSFYCTKYKKDISDKLKEAESDNNVVNIIFENEKVEPLDKTDEKAILEIIPKRIPERILLGSMTAGGRDIYWEFGHRDLANRHILVFGASGTGKTYTIQALLCELGKAGQNSLIVDYTSGFTKKQLEPLLVEKLNPSQHLIRKEPLAVNPFRQQCDFIDDIELLEDPANTAERVSGVFGEVYLLGDQQKSALYNAISKGIKSYGNKLNLRILISELEAIQAAGGPTAAPAASVISKIQSFVDMNPFGEEDLESWEKLFNDSNTRCHIIQLAGFMKDTARLITEFSLIDLYWYYRAKGSKDDPKVIVLDEIQNLDHQLDSPLGQFLTEGRKFGISLILATQTLSNLNKDERDRLFQAGHKLFFKPADTEVRSFAQILADATGKRNDEWVEMLSSLKRGECYSLGYAFNEVTKKLEVSKWFKVRIKPLEERF